jgi:D-hexose-6-phosphate mutarotase
VNSALQLQREFGIINIVSVTQRASDYPVIEVDNKYARASIALHGAHVMEFQPKGADPVHVGLPLSTAFDDCGGG